MKNYVRKPKKIPLELHKGCKGCKANCRFNSSVTTRAKNQQASDIRYGCNTSKRK